MDTATHDVIVIGAGFGGATCAALLARRGFRVLLAEKNNVSGGKAMTLHKNGFTYQAWPVMGAPVVDNWCQKLVDSLGVHERVTLVETRAGSYYRTAGGEYRAMPPMPDSGVDPFVLFDWLGIAADDRERALDFFVTLTMMPPQEIARHEGRDFDSFLHAANLPRSLYAFIVSLCLDGMYMVPVDRLDAAEAILGLQDIYLRRGGLFCKGGYGQLSDACLDAIRDCGGDVLLHARVERILVDDGHACGIEITAADSGPPVRYHAPIVVSNAGIQPTVLKLAGEHQFPPDYVARVKALVPSYSLLGYRYFLREPVTGYGFGNVFSDSSPWSSARLAAADAGQGSREGILYFEAQNNYDPDAAPAGRQVILTGSFCPPDPAMSRDSVLAWANAGEEIFFGVFPQARELIEERELYTTRSVSNATRDPTVPGTGGETIGLAQIIGQCGADKPAIETPVAGLFLVGCDAGGRGIGTQQAIMSGFTVADAISERLAR